jgi:hypothetical protein
VGAGCRQRQLQSPGQALHPLQSRFSSRYFSSRLEEQGSYLLRAPPSHAVSMNVGMRLQCGRSDTFEG